MSGVEEQKGPVIDQGEPTLRMAATFALGMGLLHAGAALVEECLRKFNFLMALLNLLFAGWLFGWLRCRDDERQGALRSALDASRRELDELKRSQSAGRDDLP